MSFTLTRNLYVRDEVEASLLTALLKKQIREAYFWGYELHYSGFDLFAVLWRIYYDVYFVMNPSLESYLSKKQELWERTKRVEVFAFCIKNMMFAKSGISSKVFVLRQYAKASGQTGAKYKGRPPAWCAEHPKKYHSWLRAICKRDYKNIALHTYALARECTGHTEDMYRELVAYFGRVIHVEPNAEDYWNTRKYSDDAHYLLSIIVFLLTLSETSLNVNAGVDAGVDADVDVDANCDTEFEDDAENENAAEYENCAEYENNVVVDVNKLLSPHKKDIDMFVFLGDDHIDGCPPYNILIQRRLHGVKPEIGGFALARYTDPDVCELDELYDVNSIWERFVFDTPFWVRKFAEYGATYDTSKKCVRFPSEDAREKFYETYGYEPDEQPTVVRDKSLGSIEKVSWKIWYDGVFKESCLIDFDPNFGFV